MGAWFVFQRHWRTAERLRQERANRRLNAIAASCQEMLWETRDDRFVYLAPTVSDYLGYQPEELLGLPVSKVLADFERQRAAQMEWTCSLTACGWQEEEFTFTAKDGELRTFRTSALAQTDGDGKVVGFAGTLRGLDGLPGRQQARRRRRQIQQLIDTQSMTTVFQPIIDTTSGMAIGAEALTRFPVPAPVLAPDQWFTAAAQAGLAAELELTALRQAFTAASATLPDNLFLAVNVSPATLLTGALAELVGQSGWDLGRIVIQITEHVRVFDYPQLNALIDPLRRRGLLLAVGDAGAGYAFFQHILALKPDYIKLDRALVAGIDIDPSRRALVKAVSCFAGDIGATVIAEGIETAQQLQAATLLGVQAAQGFHLAVPGPVSAWPDIYTTRAWITICGTGHPS